MKNKFVLIIPFLFLNIIMITSQKLDIEGHRGCRGLMPENTIDAFIHALKYNVTTLELDICISKDRKVVVSHEPYMNSLFCSHPNGKPVLKSEEKALNLFQMNYDEILKFDSGIRGNKNFNEQEKRKTYKPLLQDVFKEIESYISLNGLMPVHYNIEIKSEKEEYNISQPEVAEFSKLVYEVIIENISPERIIIQSFDFDVLIYWHNNIENGSFKKVRLAALTEKMGVKPTFKALNFKPDIFSPYYKLLTIKKIQICHKNGVKVVPWTVNNLVEMQQLKQMGVDGIITDYPNRANNLLD